jgi:hypothetical protein
MKRLLTTIALAALIVSAMATPAFAASIKLSTSAKQRATKTVVFTTTSSRRATVKVTVYRAGHKVRTISARRSGSKYVASWTGSSVTAGTYSYRVTAKASSRKGLTKGTVKVAPAPPVTVPVAVNGPSRWIGLYVPGSPSQMAPLDAAESLAGTRTAVVNFFVADSENFPTSRCQGVADRGSVPMITLEFWSIGTKGVSAISDGSKDAYLNKFADAAKSYGGEVWIRPMHEMNGDWYPWGGPVNGNSGAKYIAAWKHIHDVFAARGATNVKFVWCVNNDSVPNTSANAISAYWPGDAYVDYASMDGYNAGNTQSWSSWRPFADVFGSAYGKVAGLTSKPIFIAETSSVESGGSKAQWIADMFSVIRTKFPRLVGVCWFDANLDSDWRIETSSASTAAFHNAVAAGY